MRFIFIDGCYAPALSEPGKLAAHIMQEKGFFKLRLPADVYRQPLYFEYRTTGTKDVSHKRHIIAEEALSLLWLETHTAERQEIPSVSPIKTHFETTVDLSKNTQLSRCKYEHDQTNISHTESLHTRQASNSFFGSYLSLQGASSSYNNLRHTLEGERARCESIGLYRAREKASLQIQLTVEHKADHTQSEQLYKGIATDAARTFFQGTIAVASQLHRIVAHQRNNNLLLSSKATAITQPELLICSEDVSCTHGATVSQLDEIPLFYCQSRGITLTEAQQLLMTGFLDEVLLRFPKNPLQELYHAAS